VRKDLFYASFTQIVPVAAGATLTRTCRGQIVPLFGAYQTLKPMNQSGLSHKHQANTAFSVSTVGEARA